MSERDFDTFRHIHSVLHHEVGSVTLAFSKQGDDIHVGCSVCSPKDNFDKAKGRQLARKNPGSLILVGSSDLLHVMTLNEIAFYAIRALLPELSEAEGKQRWRKALGILAWELDLNDFGRGEKPHWL